MSEIHAVCAFFSAGEKTPFSIMSPLISCLKTSVSCSPIVPSETPSLKGESVTAMGMLVKCALSPEAKARNLAQSAILSLCQPGTQLAAAVASVVAKKVSALLGDASSGMSNAISHGQQAASALSNAVELLSLCIVSIPPKSLRVLVPSLFKNCFGKNPSVSTSVLRSLRTLCERSGPEVMTLQFVQSIIEELNKLQPSVSEEKLVIEYLAMLIASHRALQNASSDEAERALPAVFSKVASFFSAHSSPITKAVSQQLENLIVLCLTPSIIKLIPSAGQNGIVMKISRSLHDCLSFKYKHSWNGVMRTIASLFKVCGSYVHPALLPLLESVMQHHETPGNNCEVDIEKAIASAVEALGFDVFLSTVPLNLDQPMLAPGSATPPGSLPNRSWLVPIFASCNAQGTLKCFISQILPLSKKMKEMAEKFTDDDMPIKGRNLMNISDQLFGLLPLFCKRPLGVAQSFKVLAPILGMSVKEDKMRPVVCFSLTTLIKSLSEISQGEYTEEQKKEAKDGIEAVAALSRQFFPTLFNALASTQPEKRAQVLETIKSFTTIAPKPIINMFFKDVITQITTAASAAAQAKKSKKGDDDDDMDSAPDEQSSARQRLTVLFDLSVAFSSAVDQDNVKLLLTTIAPLFVSTDPKIQKRAFKIYHEVLIQQNEFVLQQYATLGSAIISANINPSSKKYWMDCSADIVQTISGAVKAKNSVEMKWVEETLCPAILPSTILCIKEISSKSRNASMNLLTTLGNAFQKFGKLDNFFKLLLAGFGATSPHMLASTAHAISKVTTEFASCLDNEYLSRLFDAIILLLNARSREVVKAALSFFKVMLVYADLSIFEQKLPQIVKLLTTYVNEAKNPLQTVVKHVFEKMMKKFDPEIIIDLAPEEYKKVLHNIRKAKERRSRLKKQMKEEKEKSKNENKEGNDNGSDSDAEFDAEITGKQKVTKRGREEETLEDGVVLAEFGDNPLDLLDQSLSGHLLSAKQAQRMNDGAKGEKALKKKKEEEDNHVKEDADGMIVVDEDISENDLSSESDGDEPMSMTGKIVNEGRTNIAKKRRTENDPHMEKMVMKSKAVTSLKEQKKQALQKAAKEMAHKEKRLENSTGKSAMYERMLLRRNHLDEAKKRRIAKQQSGENFKAKKAGGDVKRGGLDPYAYVPLDPKKALGRGKHNASQFSGLFSGK
eukprot:TRINITY_DN20092_c0_g1_i1.p1 TRINITY_DN20092_c0_g1~~TRINITY_DN20092_c0_g1_i1.p1  ORF type:complete len:1179 (-),score=397.40 TRINITY_DN20092_c0_g1_i1:21-3557(-)